jgi:hypothetical protein
MDKTALEALKQAINAAEAASFESGEVNPYPELLNAALAVAAGAAKALAADPIYGASGHMAGILGKVTSAQEMHGFAALALAAIRARLAATEKK